MHNLAFSRPINNQILKVETYENDFNTKHTQAIRLKGKCSFSPASIYLLFMSLSAGYDGVKITETLIALAGIIMTSHSRIAFSTFPQALSCQLNQQDIFPSSWFSYFKAYLEIQFSF